jgi:hypothetical protein
MEVIHISGWIVAIPIFVAFGVAMLVLLTAKTRRSANIGLMSCLAFVIVYFLLTIPFRATPAPQGTEHWCPGPVAESEILT